MPFRLDAQRAPSKNRGRQVTRPDVRGYAITPHANWANVQGKVSPSRGAAAPTDVFGPEASVTASDGTNAAKLAGLGYVALPVTNWTTGQSISVNGFLFNWTGAAWAAGAHA